MNEELEIKTNPALIWIPEGAVKITVTAILLDEELNRQTAEMALGVEDIYEARVDGEEWMSEHARYKISDEYLKQLEENKDDSTEI